MADKDWVCNGRLAFRKAADQTETKGETGVYEKNLETERGRKREKESLSVCLSAFSEC